MVPGCPRIGLEETRPETCRNGPISNIVGKVHPISDNHVPPGSRGPQWQHNASHRSVGARLGYHTPDQAERGVDPVIFTASPVVSCTYEHRAMCGVTSIYIPDLGYTTTYARGPF